jgi:hypothetical protein
MAAKEKTDKDMTLTIDLNSYTLYNSPAKIYLMSSLYGTVGDMHTEMVFGGDDTAKNTVAMLFFDDKNLSKKGGKSLINPAVK